MCPTVLHLRSLREDSGMTQVELAEAAETSQRVISRLETGGIPRADLDLLVRICKVLGVTMAELIPVPTTKRRK